MKVLIFELESKSGANIFNRILLRYLREKNIEADILTLPLRYEPILDLIRLREKLTGYIKKRILNYDKYDIIQSLSYTGSLLKADVIVFQLLNVNEDYLRYEFFLRRFYWNFWLKRQEKKSIKLAKTLTASSKYTAMKVKEVYGVVPEVIYNGIDVEQFRPLNLSKEILLKELNLPLSYIDKKIILFAGNATFRKGFDILKEVASLLDSSYLFLTCGLRTSYSQAKIISLQSIPYEKMPFLYNLCDIYFHPARLEGFGFSVAEAMACSKPIVCSNISSLPELVINKKGGLLCNLNPWGFQKAIKFLMDNPSLRLEMGQFNRGRCIENFDYNQMGNNYLSLYSALLTSRYRL